jgi:hypothetical protein
MENFDDENSFAPAQNWDHVLRQHVGCCLKVVDGLVTGSFLGSDPLVLLFCLHVCLLHFWYNYDLGMKNLTLTLTLTFNPRVPKLGVMNELSARRVMEICRY